MGKVEKGITCSVLGCEETADRSMSLAKAKMSQDLDFDNSKKRVYLCRNHYKDWKKDWTGVDVKFNGWGGAEEAKKVIKESIEHAKK